MKIARALKNSIPAENSDLVLSAWWNGLQSGSDAIRAKILSGILGVDLDSVEPFGILQDKIQKLGADDDTVRTVGEEAVRGGPFLSRWLQRVKDLKNHLDGNKRS